MVFGGVDVCTKLDTDIKLVPDLKDNWGDKESGFNKSFLCAHPGITCARLFVLSGVPV